MQEPSEDVGTELLFENEVVRVWSMVLEPGEESPYHVHHNDYLFVYTTPSRITLMSKPGAPVETRDFQDGYVNYVSVGAGVEHQIRNSADISHRQILVELKTANGVASTADNGRASEPAPR